MPNSISPEFLTGNSGDVAIAARFRISVIDGGINNMAELRPSDTRAALAPALDTTVTAPKETDTSVSATAEVPQSLAHLAYTLAEPANVTLGRLYQ